jgi:hypothetical protein
MPGAEIDVTGAWAGLADLGDAHVLLARDGTVLILSAREFRGLMRRSPTRAIATATELLRRAATLSMGAQRRNA